VPRPVSHLALLNSTLRFVGKQSQRQREEPYWKNVFLSLSPYPSYSHVFVFCFSFGVYKRNKETEYDCRSDVALLNTFQSKILRKIFGPIQEKGEWRLSYNQELYQLYSKAVPLHAMEALGGERRYSTYSFTTSALDRGECSASRPGRALLPRKGPRYPLDRRLGGPQSRSGHRG
jgi:hypothetical protein